jgi:hypothetical protein
MKDDVEGILTVDKEVSPQTGYAPSDHYGLLAEVDFAI